MKGGCHRETGSAAGFTLLELLIAIVITSLLVAVMVDSVSRCANFYQHHTGELERAAAARQVLDIITRDLSTVMLRADSRGTCLAADLLTSDENSGRWVPGGKPVEQSLQLHPPEPEVIEEKPQESVEVAGQKLPPLPPAKELPDYRFGIGGVWLRFFGLPEDRDVGKPKRGTVREPGDINAMAYQLVRCGTPTGAGSVDMDRVRYQLFRSIVDAAHTFESGYDLMSYKPAKKNTSQPGNTSELKTPHPDTLVSDQVLDIGFIFNEMNSKGKIVQAWPDRDASLPPLQHSERLRLPADGKPVEVEIYVRVISRNGAQKLASREQGKLDAEAWWHEAMQDSQLFRRTMPLLWGE